MDKIYVDQATENSYYGDRHFFAAYTPVGIKKLDSNYIKAIQEGKVDSDFLTKQIRKNPHLHPLIKENLLYNLKNRENLCLRS